MNLESGAFDRTSLPGQCAERPNNLLIDDNVCQIEKSLFVFLCLFVLLCEKSLFVKRRFGQTALTGMALRQWDGEGMEKGQSDKLRESDEIRESESNTFYPTHQPQPNPFFVTRRYWKSLVFFPLIVLLLALAATLPPVFVVRSETKQDEKDRAMTELTNAVTGLTNGVQLAFVPAASLGLWVTGRPNLRDQINHKPVEIADSYFDGSTPFQIAARNALDLVPQLGRGTILHIGLAPHGVFSAIFPLLDVGGMISMATHVFRDPFFRMGNLINLFSGEFFLEGPVELAGEHVIGTRFPVFYEASNCSCDASSPTANDVVYRDGKTQGSLFEIPQTLPTSASFTLGKFADSPERLLAESTRFPTETVFQVKGDDLPTMFCDPGTEMGLMGLNIQDFGIEWLNTSINFLPKCRFFWGFVFVQYDFDLLMSYGGSLEGLEGEGFRYSLTKKDLNGELLILSESSDFPSAYIEPISMNVTLPGQLWTLTIVPNNDDDWGGDDWKWQLALAIVGSFFLAFITFVIVYLVAYRNQYLKNVAEEFSQVTSDAMVQKKRAEASEKAAIENEAVAKKFLSTMSHELRTPLNSLLAVSELMMLESPPTSPNGKPPVVIRSNTSDSFPTPCSSSGPLGIRDCELIHDSARFLKQIVDDVLDFNKIEMGCLVISPNRFSPALALHSVARLALPLIKDPSLYFRLNIDPVLPKAVTTDEQRFKQIIMNLASNAIKFIKEGGLTISLSTVCLSSLPLSSLCSISGSVSRGSVSHSPCYLQKWKECLHKCPQDRLREIVEAHHEGEGDGKGLFVYVDVEDTGPGMPEDKQRRLFQPFYQSDPKRDMKAGGSGLGLSICADLCKVMGGVIWVTDPVRKENEEKRKSGGKGTSFRFLLPLLGAEGRVSPELIESLVIFEGTRDDHSFCQGDQSLKESGCDEMDGRSEEEVFVEVEEVEEVYNGNGTNHLSESPSELPILSPSQSGQVESPSCAQPCGLKEVESLPPAPILRVLLIDDSKLNRLVFVRMLKSLLPCIVDEAENGEDGIEMATEMGDGEEGRKNMYDLVVCDLNMGVERMNGVEVGEELERKLEYSFVMALFTADVMVELEEEERGLFEAVLYKPLSRESLIEFLVRFLDKKYFPKDFPPKLAKKRKGKKKTGGN